MFLFHRTKMNEVHKEIDNTEGATEGREGSKTGKTIARKKAGSGDSGLPLCWMTLLTQLSTMRIIRGSLYSQIQTSNRMECFMIVFCRN